jgi:hypothetical protein
MTLPAGSGRQVASPLRAATGPDEPVNLVEIDLDQLRADAVAGQLAVHNPAADGAGLTPRYLPTSAKLA